MRNLSALWAAIASPFFAMNGAGAADCKCQCLDRDGSVFGRPPGPKTPALCAEVCSRVIIDGKGLDSYCPVDGEQPVKSGKAPSEVQPPAH
jgi:hypothetical protein